MKTTFLFVFIVCLGCNGFSQHIVEIVLFPEKTWSGPVKILWSSDFEAIQDDTGALIKKPGSEETRKDTRMEWSDDGEILSIVYFDRSDSIAKKRSEQKRIEQQNQVVEPVNGTASPYYKTEGMHDWDVPVTVVHFMRDHLYHLVDITYRKHGRTEWQERFKGDSKYRLVESENRFWNAGVEEESTKTEWVYFKKSDLIEKAITRSGKTILQTMEFDYTDDGALRSITHSVYEEGKITYQKVSDYKNSMCISFVVSEADDSGILVEKIVWKRELEEHGLPSRETLTENGEIVELNYVYEFDDRGSWTKRYCTGGTTPVITVRQIIYR